MPLATLEKSENVLKKLNLKPVSVTKAQFKTAPGFHSGSHIHFLCNKTPLSEAKYLLCNQSDLTAHLKNVG